MPEQRAARAAAALLALGLLAGCSADADPGALASGAPDTDGLHGAVLTEPYELPAATLTDTSGEQVALREELDGAVTLAFFGYTHCPDICQAVMADITSALSRLDPADAEQVSMWFLTTDPRRDTPAALRDYLDRFDPGFEGLTGDLEDLTAVADGVHVAIEQGPELPGGGYEVMHGTPILAITPDGSVPVLWTEGTSAAELAEDLHTLVTDGVPNKEG